MALVALGILLGVAISTEQDALTPMAAARETGSWWQAIKARRCRIDVHRELVITDLSVVEDERTVGLGAWSFGRLMTDLAPTGMDPAVFVENFFTNWTASTSVDPKDCWTVPVGGPDQPDPTAAADRTAALNRFLDHWPKQPNGHLDLERAPFRLLAIVNRLDIREGRFVFAFISPPDNPIPDTKAGDPLDASIIFEFALPLFGSDGSVQDDQWWAEQWHALGQIPLRTENFRLALNTLTDRFATRDVMPERAFGSAINAVRTNEQISDAGPGFDVDPVWQLRNFVLHPTTGTLTVAAMPDTPDLDYDTWACGDGEHDLCQQQLIDYILEHRAEILTGTHVVDPNQIQLGGAAPMITPAFRWFRGVETPAGISEDDWEAVRLQFSLRTCNGCHCGDGNDNDKLFVPQEFQQLKFRAEGEESTFAPFLESHIEAVRIPHMKSFVCPGDPTARRVDPNTQPVH